MTDQARDDEREALDALLQSRGWAILTAYLDRNWGPKAYRERCRREVHKLPLSAAIDVTAQLSILQVEAVTDAMEALARFPGDRVKALKKLAEKPAARRRMFGRGAAPNE